VRHPSERVRAPAATGGSVDLSDTANLPDVSVVVCAYNYERWLSAALDSALAQNHPSFEVIVVDDGSTDGTPDVIASYGDRIRAVRRPNGGLNAATTTGMRMARGRYLTFLDADDFWPQGRLRVLADALDAHPEAGLVYGDMDMRGPDGELAARSFREATGLQALSGRIFGRLVQNNVVSAGALMVRASLRELFHPIPAYACHQDWWIATRVAAVSELLAIPDVVNHYRLHETNMNLGARGERRTRLWASEFPFRRSLLQTADPALVSPRDALAALAQLDHMVATVQTDAVVRDALAPDRPAAIVCLDSASAALDLPDTDAACVHVVRAAAHDLDWPEPRLLLRELAPYLTTAPTAQLS
jgi:Glycosyl transferase family 2